MPPPPPEDWGAEPPEGTDPWPNEELEPGPVGETGSSGSFNEVDAPVREH